MRPQCGARSHCTAAGGPSHRAWHTPTAPFLRSTNTSLPLISFRVFSSFLPTLFSRFTDPRYLALAAACALAAFLLWRPLERVAERSGKGREFARFRDAAVEAADALGLGAFAVLGAQAAQGLGHGAGACLACALLGATGGGVVRDVLTLTPPRVLSSKQELYATCALAGAAAFLFLPLGGDARAVVGVVTTGAGTSAIRSGTRYCGNSSPSCVRASFSSARRCVLRRAALRGLPPRSGPAIRVSGDEPAPAEVPRSMRAGVVLRLGGEAATAGAGASVAQTRSAT